MDYLFLGIDLSTQSCKFVVISLESHYVVYVDSLNYDSDLPHYRTINGAIPNHDPDISESDPNMWIESLNILFQRLSDSDLPIRSIKAISVSGQQHGLVALDQYGNHSRKTCKLWNDISTQDECTILTRSIGGIDNMLSEIGNTQRPGYTASKIFHMYRHEPYSASNTSTFFTVHNYINWYLTNGIRVMEPGDVSGMALSFPGSTTWSENICNQISPELISKLPEVKPSDQIIGSISSHLVDKYGFSPECQIDAGCGDNMYSAVGTGNITPGTVTVSLGTSGTIYTILEKPFVDPDGEIALCCDSTGKFMPLVCVSNMSNAYNSILNKFGMSHDDFNETLKLSKPGNDGRILFPWFSGERTPDLPNARPVYYGFQTGDFTKHVLSRSIIEGLVLNLFYGYAKMPCQAKEIRLTGGLSKSDSWCQTISDIFDVETVPVDGEGAASGAAIHAAWVYLKSANKDIELSDIAKLFIRLDENRRCFPQNAQEYSDLKCIYIDICKRFRLKEVS